RGSTSHKPNSRAAAHQCLAKSGQVANGDGTSRLRSRLARALAHGGRVITLEANPMHAKIARANVAHAGLADRVDIRLGKALDLLPTLAGDGPFDFIYIDADQENAANYFQWAVKLARRGSLIVTDNVIRHGSIIDGENSKPAVQGLRRFYDLVAAEPKVNITA